MTATSGVRQAGGWALFGLIAAVAVHFLGFVALTVLCLVIAVALARAATTARGWIRVALCGVALVVAALPVLLYLEMTAGSTVLRVS